MQHILKSTFTFILLCLVFSVSAQAPPKFNYQGIARDANGNPIANQRMSIQLEILPSLEATQAEYQETQTITTNEFGLYTLQIGNGIPTVGDMKLVKWETGNQYIHVRIDPSGGNQFVEAGTTQLLSVPYALYADKAGVARESLNGNTQKNTRATNNYIEKTSGAGVANSTSLLYDNGTSIGLGTTTPTARFQISQNIASVQEHLRMHNSSPTGAGRFTMYNDGASSYATFTKYGTAYAGNYGGSSLYPNANLLAFGNNGVAAGDGLGRFLITNGGSIGMSLYKSGVTKLKFHADFATENVGIGGNAAPIARLHANNTDGTTMDIRLTNNTTGHTATDGLEIKTLGTAASITNIENDVFTLGTNNNPSITLTASGNTELAGQIKIAGGVPGAGKILTSDATGLATWETNNAWNILGNAGTTSANFIGTIDNMPLEFRINNIVSGKIESYGTTRNTSIGSNRISNGGFDNTIFGAALNPSLYFTGGQNTLIGNQTGESLTLGSGNTFLGEDAGRTDSSGSDNIFIGEDAGNNNYSGNKNTIVGHLANVSADALSYATAIGANAVVSASNSVVLGRTTDKVGIGLTAPQSTLDVFTSVGANKALGVPFNFSSYNGFTSVKNGLSGPATTSGILGACAGNNFFNGGVIGIANGGSVAYGVYGTASAGSSASFGVFCNGSGGYTGTWTSTSDIKFKKDFQAISNALSKVMQLKPTTYLFKADEYTSLNFPTFRQYGFIAQEVETVLPTLVEKGSHLGDKEGESIDYKGVNYIGMIPILTQAIQEQQQIIDELKKEIELLKAKK